MINERGLFNVSKVRSIIDKLIYADTYKYIDSAISDSNIGTRKKRSVTDNLFVTYSVIYDELNKKEKL